MSMETILVKALEFLGASIAGGITWDGIKGAGGALLANFKKQFVKEEYFENQNEVEVFWEDISTRESLNKRHPLKDIWAVYDNCTGKEASDLFKEQFMNWITANLTAIEHLGEEENQVKGIYIKKQVNKDNAQVKNIGNQYN